MTTASDPWAALSGRKYISLETFKKSGAGVKTPVWFARDGDRLIIYTKKSAWKVKRLRRNPDCLLAACNVSGAKILGPWLEGTCTRLEGPDAEGEALALLKKKYLMLRLTNPLTVRFAGPNDRAFYAIERRAPKS